jgi:hypothetical protein
LLNEGLSTLVEYWNWILEWNNRRGLSVNSTQKPPNGFRQPRIVQRAHPLRILSFCESFSLVRWPENDNSKNAYQNQILTRNGLRISGLEFGIV